MNQGAPMDRPKPAQTHPDQRWCPTHWRWECSKNSQRTKVGCHKPAIRGTATCDNHGGKKRELLKAQGEAITAWSALTGEPTVDHNAAVIGMLNMSWARVHLYAQLLREQVEAAQAARGTDPEDAIGGGTRGAVGAGAGLVGHTYAGGESGIIATGEAIRALAVEEGKERDRCVRYAKTAHDMGIAERQIEAAEKYGAQLAGVMVRFARLLGRDPTDPEVQRAAQLAISEETGVGPKVLEGTTT